MLIQPLGKLCDDRHRRTALASFRLLPMTTPVRLRNADWLPIVIFPSETAQFALTCAGKRSRSNKGCRRATQSIFASENLLQRVRIYCSHPPPLITASGPRVQFANANRVCSRSYNAGNSSGRVEVLAIFKLGAVEQSSGVSGWVGC